MSLVVLAPVARGGSGSVHLALRRGDTFRRFLALKRLRGALNDDEGAREELFKEAAYAASIRHPNVVEVIDVGADREGAFLLMDFVHGVSLRELLEATPLSTQLALRVALAVARGLCAAHEQRGAKGEPLGLMHRDVTPANVMVGFDGSVQLTDFGLARTHRDPRTQELLRGTSGYIAPEQLRFDAVDQRADLFALGVLLHEMLAGRRLYGDDDVRAAARRVLGEAPPRLEGLGADLTHALLQKAPDDRPKDARTVVRQLEALVRQCVREDGPERLRTFLQQRLAARMNAHRTWLASSAQNFKETPKPAATRRRLPMAAAAAGSIVAASILAASLMFNGSSDPSPAQRETRPPAAAPSSPDAGREAAAPAQPVATQPAEAEGSPRPASEPARARRARPSRDMRAGRRRPRARETMADCVLGWDGRCE
ncbi:MAG: serine/threonine-protein kinase [Myxococcota bacterium]